MSAPSKYLKNINSFNPHNKQPFEVFTIPIFRVEKNDKYFPQGHITNK